jgi:hypothetical protein
MARESTSTRRFGGSLAVWLVGGAAILLVLNGALPSLCLFLPSLLVLVTEEDRSRPLTRALLLFGLAGAWDSLGSLWKFGGLGLANWHPASLFLALDVRRVAVAWAAQGGGWLLSEALAIAFSLIAERRASSFQAKAERRKSELQAEWLTDPSVSSG